MHPRTDAPLLAGREERGSEGVWVLLRLLRLHLYRLDVRVGHHVAGFDGFVVIFARAAEELVGAASSEEVVIAVATIEQVVACTADEDVVPRAAHERGAIPLLLGHMVIVVAPAA